MRRVVLGSVVVAVVGLLATVKVGKRITSIDLSTIYPAIEDSNEGRSGTVISAGDYPSFRGIAYYHLQTSRGSITLACSVDDSNSWIDSRKSWKIGPASQRIGDDVFFKNETDSEETLELAYRRHNLGVCFRNSPNREYRGGRPIFTSETDKKELEETARKLDNALLAGNARIQTEDVRFYQVVSHKLRSSVGNGYLWITYHLLGPM